MTKKSSDGPESFWQLGNPFLGVMLDTDVSEAMFQPMRAIAIGQINTLALINRRLQACMTLPHELASCRSPNDFVQTNLRFFQMALRDYSDAVENIAKAWDETVSPPAGDQARAAPRHDYLVLPNGADPSAEADEAAEKSGPAKGCAA